MTAKIQGVIQRIIFKNEENSYAVVSLKLDYKDKETKELQNLIITNVLTVTCYYDRIPIKDEE